MNHGRRRGGVYTVARYARYLRVSDLSRSAVVTGGWEQVRRGTSCCRVLHLLQRDKKIYGAEEVQDGLCVSVCYS